MLFIYLSVYRDAWLWEGREESLSSRLRSAWIVHRIHGVFRRCAWHQMNTEHRGRGGGSACCAGGTGFKALPDDRPSDINYTQV